MEFRTDQEVSAWMHTVSSNLQDILYEIAENSPQQQLEGKYGVSSSKSRMNTIRMALIMLQNKRRNTT
jgi:hypothetical protein